MANLRVFLRHMSLHTYSKPATTFKSGIKYARFFSTSQTPSLRPTMLTLENNANKEEKKIVEIEPLNMTVSSRPYMGSGPQEEVVVDNKGARWIRQVDAKSGEAFYYNEETWETIDGYPDTTKLERPKYSTAWEDERFPQWVQFLDTSSMRKYYYNLSNGEVTWSPPDKPGLDIFQAEFERSNRALTKVPEDTPSAPIARRLAAVAIDIGIITALGGVLGTMMYFELDDLQAAQSGAGILGWASFLGRDMVFESGTRSVGKRLMKLEVVRMDGQLPTRWNTAFRSITAPIYIGFAAGLVPYAFLFATLDLGTFLFTPKATRIGDIVARTRVIPELPDREERMKEKIEFDLEADREKPVSMLN